MDNYIVQRLASIGTVGGNLEVETLRAENARLRQQLEQAPDASFKSEVQTVFEQSPQFENILNAFLLRFMREKFSVEFRDSVHTQEFQVMANKAFIEFEKNYKKEAPKNAQGNKGVKRTGAADSGENQSG